MDKVVNSKARCEIDMVTALQNETAPQYINIPVCRSDCLSSAFNKVIEFLFHNICLQVNIEGGTSYTRILRLCRLHV